MEDNFPDLLMINQTLDKIARELGAIYQTLNAILTIYAGTIAETGKGQSPDQLDDLGLCTEAGGEK